MVTVSASERGAAPHDALVRAAWQRAGEPPVSVKLHSTIPIGAGLGGSSAAGVALAAALAEWNGITHSAHDLAELSRSTEIETLGVAGGCQDHYAAAYGGALLLRCAAETTAHPIVLQDETVTDFEARALIAYTGESRMSSRTITAVLDAYRAGEAQTCDALATMAGLAHDMATALHDGDIDHLGALLQRQWAAQRALHPTITTALIDRLVDEVTVAGAVGAKALGASGGGCVLVIARADCVEQVRSAIEPLATLLPLRIARSGVQVHVNGGNA